VRAGGEAGSGLLSDLYYYHIMRKESGTWEGGAAGGEWPTGKAWGRERREASMERERRRRARGEGDGLAGGGWLRLEREWSEPLHLGFSDGSTQRCTNL